MKQPKMKKYRIDCEMTLSGYRTIEAYDEDDAQNEADSFVSGISADEFYSSFEIEQMPSTEVLWVTEEKPKSRKATAGPRYARSRKV